MAVGSPLAVLMGISIHAPREGGDSVLALGIPTLVSFQSTPPARGATTPVSHQPSVTLHFNPRPPRGGRRRTGYSSDRWDSISIHAPREGGDISWAALWAWWRDFNPRPPRGGRPSLYNAVAVFSRISIHAPREGGDFSGKAQTSKLKPFQSTPPARGATRLVV